MADHEVWLVDDFGKRLDQLNDIFFISASRVVNGIGFCVIKAKSTFDTDLLVKDRMFQLWRKPDGGAMSLWRTYFYRKGRFETKGSKEIIVIGGPDVNDLLRRRITANYSDQASNAINDYSDDMMKTLVTDSMSDALLLGVTAGTREWANLTVATDTSSGPILNKQFLLQRLLTPSGSGGALTDIAKASEIVGTPTFFDIQPKVVTANTISFEFRTFIDQVGADRTDLGLVFDQDIGTLRDPFLDWDASQEVNYVYAGGQGAGSARDIQQVYDATRHGESQWARCEGFADARDQDTGKVEQAGQAVLFAGRPIFRFGGIPLDTAGSRFGVDWNFGDRAKARYRKFEFAILINGITLTVENNKETIAARLDYQYV